MATKEKELPGLVLHIFEHALNPCAGKDFKANGTITLTAEVQDFTVWDKVVEKLEGLAVYSVATLTETLVTAAQIRANRAEQAAMQATEEARARVESLEADLAFRLKEVQTLQELVKQKDQEIEVLSACVNELDKKRTP